MDESSLAGTLALDRIAERAAEVGAKVVLIGDWAQLSAVETGGAFGMLARRRDQVPELTDVRRFANEWEKTASLGLRHGDVRDALIFVVCGSVAGFGCWDAKLLGYGQRAAFFRRCRVWQSSAGFQA